MKDIYIAIDFDGTIVQHAFPEIGKEVPHAVRVIQRLMERSNVKLILLTMRGNSANTTWRDHLEEAVVWCEQNGLTFWSINTNPSQDSWTNSPKVYAAIYIDDAALGCPLIVEDGRPYVDWLEVEQLLEVMGILDGSFKSIPIIEPDKNTEP